MVQHRGWQRCGVAIGLGCEWFASDSKLAQHLRKVVFAHRVDEGERVLSLDHQPVVVWDTRRWGEAY